MDKGSSEFTNSMRKGKGSRTPRQVRTPEEEADMTRFDNACQFVHVFIEASMEREWDVLLSALYAEHMKYPVNVWLYGPQHIHLAALLRSINLSPEEWAVTVTRAIYCNKDSSLTSDQRALLKRFDTGAGILTSPSDPCSPSDLSVSDPQPVVPEESRSEGEFKGSTEAMDSDSCKKAKLKRKSKKGKLKRKSAA